MGNEALVTGRDDPLQTAVGANRPTPFAIATTNQVTRPRDLIRRPPPGTWQAVALRPVRLPLPLHTPTDSCRPNKRQGQGHWPAAARRLTRPPDARATADYRRRRTKGIGTGPNPSAELRAVRCLPVPPPLRRLRQARFGHPGGHPRVPATTAGLELDASAILLFGEWRIWRPDRIDTTADFQILLRPGQVRSGVSP